MRVSSPTATASSCAHDLRLRVRRVDGRRGRRAPGVTGSRGVVSPRLVDLGRVRARLERDRPWSAYALGDLSPQFRDAAEWHSSANDEALVLVFRGFTPPIVFGIGPADGLHVLFQEIDAPAISLQLARDAVAGLAPRFDVVVLHPMSRMVLSPAAWAPPDLRGVAALGPADADAVRALYTDGDRLGDGPDFFAPSMMNDGLFRGVWDGDALIAVAGTHLSAAEIGVCAIGNVYTRTDRRGLGLGAKVTAAVAVEALRRGMSTIVLNVRHANDGARRVYERLGFAPVCDFVEGVARRREPSNL